MIAGVRLSVLIMGAMALLASGPSSNAQTAAKEPAVSYPNDGRFLGDKIEFRLLLANQERPFDIFARPGQMTYISIPVMGQPGMVQKYALVLMPESAPGIVAQKYQDLPLVENAEVTFTAVFFCIEEMPSEKLLGEPVDSADLAEPGACRPRRKDIQLFDDVRFLFRRTGLALKSTHMISQLATDAQQAEVLASFFKSIQITKYVGGEGGPSKDLACLTVKGVDVCGCRVAVGSISSRNFCKE